MNVNKVILIGNITRDPELKQTTSGTKVASFSLATNETYNGEQKTEFHNIVVFGKLAENIAQYMKKGSQLYVEGKIQTRSWDTEAGEKRQRTEIVALTAQFGAKPQGTSQTSSAEQSPYTYPNTAPDAPADVNVDDIPF